MDVDVAILGGGLAGNLLARQLRREVPDASVLMVEQASLDARRWKVGESTVEIAAHYLVSRQGLGTYLLDRHLPKYGLRFFFDDEARSTELPKMSEIGTDRPPPTPSFQLDRARFEADLTEMNRALGVDVRRPATARALSMAGGDATDRHSFRVEGPSGSEGVRARWLFDATGRASSVARQKDLRRETDHRLGAVWGRFERVVDFDHLPAPPEWRGRVRHTTRTLSTNHFCYPGYWIWFIPLGRGVTSVGVVGEREHFRRGMRTPEGFTAFLREHQAAASLLEHASLLDVAGHTQLAYAVDRFFDGGERWGLLGDAAAFTDPFYSPGSDFIALECDYATDLVRRDLAGESPEAVADTARTFDAFMQFRWRTTMLLYRDLYRCFGSYELMRVKLNFDLGCYYNLWLDPVMRDRHLDPRFLMGELRRAGDNLDALKKFSGLFRAVHDRLRRDGTYFRGNTGRYNRGVDVLLDLVEEVGRPRKRRDVIRRTEEIFNYGRLEARRLLDHEPPADAAPWSLMRFGEAASFAGE